MLFFCLALFYQSPQYEKFVNSVVIFAKPSLTLGTQPMLFNPVAQPFIKDHSKQLCLDRPNRYPHVVVKFGGIAPFKERMDHPNGKGFWKALRQKVIERCQ